MGGVSEEHKFNEEIFAREPSFPSWSGKKTAWQSKRSQLLIQKGKTTI